MELRSSSTLSPGPAKQRQFGKCEIRLFPGPFENGVGLGMVGLDFQGAKEQGLAGGLMTASVRFHPHEDVNDID